MSAPDPAAQRDGEAPFDDGGAEVRRYLVKLSAAILVGLVVMGSMAAWAYLSLGGAGAENGRRLGPGEIAAPRFETSAAGSGVRPTRGR